jgi:hypothetical protein
LAIKSPRGPVFLNFITFNYYFITNFKYYLSKEDEMGRTCSMNGEKRNACRILVGKPQGKRPLGRPRCRGVDNIKIDLRKTEWDGMDWNDLAQDRDQWRALVNMVMNLWVS